MKKHGMSKSPEYTAWRRMRRRCNFKKDSEYHNYGARGIKVCYRWEHSFENFLSDMGKRPSNGHSLDRIDVNKGYFPANCRWATNKEQSNNTRRNVFVEYNGKTLTLKQLSEELNINYNSFFSRIRLGWSLEKIMSTPIDKKFSNSNKKKLHE